MAESAEDTEHTWWAAPRFLLSAAGIVVLVVLGIIFLVWDGGDEDSGPGAAPSAAAGQRPPVPETSAPAADGGGSVCGLEAEGGRTLTAAPEDVGWEFVNGLAAPTSAEHGPGVVDPDSGVRSCYSHTPAGALLAVTNLYTAGGDPNLLADTIEELAVDGPGKEQAVDGVRRRAAEGSSTLPPIKVEGFRLLTYDGREATVEVVVSGDTGSEKIYFTESAVVVWKDGDWYFRIREDGSTGPVAGQISDLSGYIAWGPGNG